MDRMQSVVRKAAAAVVVLAAVAQAFDGQGHWQATQAAVRALPADVPAFFRSGVDEMADGAMDPDVFKLDSLPQLRNGEYPEHYFDIELLQGRTPPARRYEFLDLCARQGMDPGKVGTLPYALAEWTQRLTVAFAQHRRWPDNRILQHKCLVYAGILAHYAQDACQPLHTTIHYDGRVGPDGKSPRSGIHAKVDAVIQKVPVEPAVLAKEMKVEPLDQLWPGILRQLEASHALVDKTYALEKEWPARATPLPADSKAADFARDRLAAAARFTANLYLTAWRDSAKLELPDWHVRERQVVATGSSSQP